jgi:hypothetical protein
VAKFVLLNCRPFLGSADLTSVSNKCEFAVEIEEKDVTTFTPTGDVWAEKLGGIRGATWSGEGFWEAGDASKVDDATFADLGAVRALTVAPQTAAVGAMAYVTAVMRTSYEQGASVGDAAPWTAEASGSWPAARGVILHDPGTARTTTGTGTAVQVGAALTGQYAYATLHVLSFTGTGTVTVRVESDDAVGFPSAATVGTFTGATGRGSEVIRTAGPITDTYFRAAWTVTGTPSALFVVGFGIQ